MESQHMYLGIGLNAQGLFDYLFAKKPKLRKVTHGLFEVFSAPFGSAPLLEKTKLPSGPVEGGGA